MSDDGFHEIQLNGKQLVFLFMATTVVSVVIFLCGVLVGRGVRAERGVDPQELTDVGPIAPPVADAGVKPAPLAGGSEGVAPGAPGETLTYPKQLEGNVTASAETLRITPDQPHPPVVPEPAPQDKAEPPPPPPAVSQPASPLVKQPGFTIQVAALRERGEAEAIMKRLAGKGYSAYVIDPTAGTPSKVYRVRVGRFGDRREAEQIVRRLEKEEQFKPWITR